MQSIYLTICVFFVIIFIVAIKGKKTVIADKLVSGFSNRLQETMINGGYASDRKPYYVDLIRLSKEANINPTMLRRYLAGQAMPQFNAIEKISEILGVDPFWLFCGYKDVSPINEELLRSILLEIKELLKQNINNDHAYKTLTSFACDIYNHINQTKAVSNQEKNKLIKWMVDGFSLSCNKKYNTAMEDAI